MVINLKTEHWTEDQVWALYQLVDQLYNHLHENHGETIQYCEWRDARLPTGIEWEILMTQLPIAYQDINEWTNDEDSLDGQSQMYTFVGNEFRGIWLEDSYLSNDLSFRCVQPQ